MKYSDPDNFEAVQVSEDAVDYITEKFWSVPILEIDPEDSSKTFFGMNVMTSAGAKRANEGDWIVKYSGGTVVVVTPEVFTMEYE